MQEGWTLWDSSFTHTQEAGKALLVLWEAQAASGERAEVFCFHFSFPGDGMEGPSSVEMGALMQEKQPLQNWLPSFTGTWWGKKKKERKTDQGDPVSKSQGLYSDLPSSFVFPLYYMKPRASACIHACTQIHTHNFSARQCHEYHMNGRNAIDYFKICSINI